MCVCACVAYVACVACPLSRGPACLCDVCSGLLCRLLMQRGAEWKWTEPTLCLPASLTTTHSSVSLQCVCVHVHSPYHHPTWLSRRYFTHTWSGEHLFPILPPKWWLIIISISSSTSNSCSIQACADRTLRLTNRGHPPQTSQVTCATTEGASARRKPAPKDADKRESEGKTGDDLEEWKQSAFGWEENRIYWRFTLINQLVMV